MFNQLLAKLLFLFLPFQLGYHFWPEYSRIFGLKVDYLSPTIYVTHIFILFIILVNYSILKEYIKNNLLKTILYFLLVLTNINYSLNPQISIFRWLELTLLIGLSVVISQKQKEFFMNINWLFLGVYAVFTLQIAQIINNSSIQGIFYWLGERKFDLYTPSLPKVFFDDVTIIRVPSTFSHANALGGYMLLILTMVKVVFPKLTIVHLISFVSLVLSFSKNAILNLVIFTKIKINYKKLLILCALISILLPITPNNQKLPYYFSSRLEGYHQNISISGNHIMFGTGLGAYLNGLSLETPASKTTYEHLQPVHNIFQLTISELGILGLILVYSLVKDYKPNKAQLAILTVVLATGLFDHYWLTQIQNKTLLVVSLSLFSVKYWHGKVSRNTNKY